MEEGVRSLNIAVAWGIALSEALRQTGLYPAGLLWTGNNRRHAIGSRACAIAYAWNSKRSSVRTEAMHASLTRLGIGRRKYRVLWRSEEHTSELQSLMRISYAVYCFKKLNIKLYYDILTPTHTNRTHQ